MTDSYNFINSGLCCSSCLEKFTSCRTYNFKINHDSLETLCYCSEIRDDDSLLEDCAFCTESNGFCPCMFKWIKLE